MIWSFLHNGTLALIGIVRAKYMAVVFGAGAVGLLSQVFQLQLISISLGSLAMANGIISALTTARSDQNEKTKILSTAFSLQMTVTLTILLTVLLMGEFFADFTFGSSEYSYAVYLTMVGVPFMVLSNHQLLAIYFAHEGFNTINKLAIVINVLNLLLFFVLAKVWGIVGAISTATTLAVIQFVFYTWGAKKFFSFKQIFKWGFDRKQLHFLLEFSFATMTTTILLYSANFLIRREVISTLGLSLNGILQVPISLSLYYVPIIGWVLWGKIYPMLVSEKLLAAEKFRSLMIKVMAGFVVMAIFIIALKKYIVLLLLTDEFLPALPLIPLYLMGDLFFILNLCFGAYLLALKHLKIYIAGHLIFAATYVGLTTVWIADYDLFAVPIAFLAASSLTFVLLYMYLLKKLPRISGKSILLVAIVGLVTLELARHLFA